MGYKLFLDDERMPINCIGFFTPEKPIYREEDWVIVRTYEDFVDVVTRHWEIYDKAPAMISFDHDLGTEKSGKDCANWLVNFCIEKGMPFNEYIVHSQNTVGAENITSFLNQYKRHINGI
jgi:hypothetical protein